MSALTTATYECKHAYVRLEVFTAVNMKNAIFLGTDILEEHIASIIKVERISELETILSITSI
jgi:hypothetical protein